MPPTPIDTWAALWLAAAATVLSAGACLASWIWTRAPRRPKACPESARDYLTAAEIFDRFATRADLLDRFNELKREIDRNEAALRAELRAMRADLIERLDLLLKRDPKS